MTISIIVSVLAGMAIGLRFKVLMIVPAIFVAAFSTTAITIAQGEHRWAIISAIVLSAIAVQVGYLCGTFASSVKESPAPNPAPAATAPTKTYRARTGISVQFPD